MLKLEALESRCLLSATVADFDANLENAAGFTLIDDEGKVLTDLLAFDPVFTTSATPSLEAEHLFKVANNSGGNLTLYSVSIEGDGFGIGKASAQDIKIPEGHTIKSGESLRFLAVFEMTNILSGEYGGTLTINKGLETEQAVDLVSMVNPCFVTKSTPMTFTDASGDLVKIKLNEGTATVYLSGNKADNAANTENADIAMIKMTDTTAKSTLTITSKGEVPIGAMTASSSLKAINAPKANLAGALTVQGDLTALSLNNVAATAAITIDDSPASKPMTIKAADLGGSIHTDGAIKSVTVLNTISADITAGTDLGTVKASKGAISGDLVAETGAIKSVSAASDISGDITAGTDLGTVKASKGMISGDLMAQTGAIKSVSAAGDISGAVMAKTSIGTIASKATLEGVLRAESIKSITALDMNNAIVSVSKSLGSVAIKHDVIDSHVLAGYDIAFSVNNLSDDSFAAGTIKSFKFGGQFTNSFVNAGTMTEASYIRLNGALPSGADYSETGGQIGSVSGKINEASSGGFFSSGTIKTKLVDMGDFVIRQNA